MSLKSHNNGQRSAASQPISLRLAPAAIERLQSRAHILSGTITGVARDLILTGLAGGDNKSLADRLMAVERRLAALEGLIGNVGRQAERIDTTTRELCTKFDALLTALSSSDGAAQ